MISSLNQNISLLNNINNIEQDCELLQDIKQWQNKLNDVLLSVLHINIRSLRLNWDLLCIKINDLLKKLDILI